MEFWRKDVPALLNIKLKIAAWVVMRARLCQTVAYVIQSELALQLRLARLPHRWKGAATTYPFEDLTQSFPLPQWQQRCIFYKYIHITLGAWGLVKEIVPRLHLHLELHCLYFFLLAMRLKTWNSWSCNDYFFRHVCFPVEKLKAVVAFLKDEAFTADTGPWNPMLHPWEFPGNSQTSCCWLTANASQSCSNAVEIDTCTCVHTHTHTHIGVTITHLLSIFACHRGTSVAGLMILPTCFSPSPSKTCCWCTERAPTPHSRFTPQHECTAGWNGTVVSGQCVLV